MAPPDATDREPAAASQPVRREGLLDVGGTRRVEAAVRPQQGRHKAPIYPNDLNQSGRNNLPHFHTDPPVALAGSAASGVGAASTPSNRRQLSRWPATSENAAPTAVFRPPTTKSTVTVLARSSSQSPRFCLRSRVRSPAAPAA